MLTEHQTTCLSIEQQVILKHQQHVKSSIDSIMLTKHQTTCLSIEQQVILKHQQHVNQRFTGVQHV